MTSRWLIAIALVACGEEAARSGVDPSVAVIDLTSEDVQIFCDWAIALQGGVGHSHACDDGSTLTTRSVANCVDTLADLTCTDTIGAIEECLLAVEGDLCLIPTTAACAAFDACFGL